MSHSSCIIFCHFILNQMIQDFLGEANLKEIINFSLHYIADLDIPVKRSVMSFTCSEAGF